MNFQEMFADSIHMRELHLSITAETSVQEILLQAQGTVNAFVSSLGTFLVSDFIADTFMMYCEAFSTDAVKYFSVGVILFNRGTNKQSNFVLPFKIILSSEPGSPDTGLYMA